MNQKITPQRISTQIPQQISYIFLLLAKLFFFRAAIISAIDVEAVSLLPVEIIFYFRGNCLTFFSGRFVTKNCRVYATISSNIRFDQKKRTRSWRWIASTKHTSCNENISPSASDRFLFCVQDLQIEFLWIFRGSFAIFEDRRIWFSVLYYQQQLQFIFFYVFKTFVFEQPLWSYRKSL